MVSIGILPPEPSRAARLSRLWLSRGPALGRQVLSLLAAYAVAFAVMGQLLKAGVPGDMTVPVALLPLCVMFAPTLLDAAARHHVHVVESSPGITTLQEIIIRHQQIANAYARAPIPELGQAVRLSHQLLWDCATLLQTCPGHATDRRFQAYEEPHAMLVDQALAAAAAHVEKEFVVSLPLGTHGASDDSPDPLPDGDLLAPEDVADKAQELNDLATATRYATSRLHPPAASRRSDGGGEEDHPAADPDWWRSYPAQG
ncbi:hypothetical protein RCO28_34285 [Streptomyces sp. LHD-70]|uniref:hypothetical protein n=1 Tax=Streptomyces sp. LHD-70 TaxID=3072140 RepID=UPI00280E9648|nr:hypothetical protein [Streptomyces sp. LHD-70]MDQ8707502.1 hypothetical protein [Streptomyces sp. LHD-70]